MRKNIAVILAGGVGSRIGADVPKQFFKVAGKTVMEHTIEIFQKCNLIDEIAVVIHPHYVNDVEAMVLNNNWDKVKKILNGGKERYESSQAAIRAYSNDSNINIIFHDAVRPLLNQSIISDIIQALDKYDAVDVAIPAVDTIIETKIDKNEISQIPNRKFLRRGQTPQAFKIDTIRKAYEMALMDGPLQVSDDCGVVAKYLPNVPIYIVEGEERNIKLTNTEDIYLLDKLFQINAQSMKQNIDLHLLEGKVIVIFGGNSGIGSDMITLAKNHGAKAYTYSRSINNVDIKDIDNVRRALIDVHNKEGVIDYIVNSAAVLNREPLIHIQPETIRNVIETNYYGMINVSVCAFPYLKQSHGQLLHFTSSSYTRGRAFYSLYSSTKAAVVNFVQAISQEWEPFKIRVNCINPERTKTPMREKNFGIEAEDSLLLSSEVAKVSLQTLLSNFSGQVVDVKLHNYYPE